MRRARSSATRRSYAEDWARFREWCAATACEALPADPLVVMFYLGHLAPTWRPRHPSDPPDAVTSRGEVCESPGLSPPTLARHLAAIAAHHLDEGYASPTHDPRVSQMLESERLRAADPVRQRVAPAVADHVRELVAPLVHQHTAGLAGDRDPVATRDLAMILLGACAALGPAQIAALTLDQVREDPDGAWIDVLDPAADHADAVSTGDATIRGSTSTHIPAAGDDACPVAAWRRWRAWLDTPGTARADGAPATGSPRAAAFRSIRRGPLGGDDPASRASARSRIGAAALTERSVSRILRARTDAAGAAGRRTAGHLDHPDVPAAHPAPDRPRRPSPRPVTEPDAPGVFRLVYRSRLAVLPRHRSAEMAAILAVSRRVNPRRGVTGALLVQHDVVVQALEGREDVVRDLYAAIAADPRHHSVTTLEARHLPTRTFGRWSMAKIAPSGTVGAPSPAEDPDEIREGPRTPRPDANMLISAMRTDAGTGRDGAE